MNNSSGQKKLNSNVIEIPFDPSRTPREQIEAAIASVTPGKCQSHPHETLPVDKMATVTTAVCHDCPYQNEPRHVVFRAVYERCSHCPHSDIGGDFDVDECPATPFRRGGRNLGACDEKGILLPEICESAALESERSAQDQFNAWLPQNETAHCDHYNENLPRREAHMTPPFKTWRIEPQYACCPQCGLERLGISPDEAFASFENFTLEPPEIQKHWETCRTFAANSHGVLLLLGNCGTGKTHLSIACLRERLKAGDTDLQFVKHRHFIGKHRLSLRAVPFGQEAPESPLPSCRKAGFLVYDEISAPTDGYALEDVLLDLFEKRIGDLKPSIITSNLTRNELEPALGSRLFDRLRRAAFAVLEFGFESRRQLHNEEYLERYRAIQDRRRS